MVLGFLLLMVFWLLGESLTQLIGWPVPGNVVGLVLLWLALVCYRKVPETLQKASTGLIRYLTLLFVPAGVGLIQHWDRLMSSGHWILLAITLSTLLAAGVMILIFKLFRLPQS